MSDEVKAVRAGTGLPPYLNLLPGLLLTAILCAAAFALAAIPGLKLAGPLGLALLLGVIWRNIAGTPAIATPGIRFSAKTILRLGIVLLGVRLDFGLLYQSGFRVLALDLLVVAVGLVAITLLGKLFKLPKDLSLLLAVGSSICGASAIAAAAPITGAKEKDVSQAVGIISVLGFLAVLGYTFVAPLIGMSQVDFGVMVGATMQEVGHVLAAGAAGGQAALDSATVAKLTRVALLAPVLLLVSAILNRRSGNEGQAVTSSRAPLVPGFLLGFLALGVVNSLGWIPTQLAASLQQGSLILTTAAMAAIGLGVDAKALRNSGLRAIAVAAIGFLLLVGITATYLSLV